METHTISHAQATLASRYPADNHTIVNHNDCTFYIPVYTRKERVKGFIQDAVGSLSFMVEDLLRLFVYLVKCAIVCTLICSPWIIGYFIENL